MIRFHHAWRAMLAAVAALAALGSVGAAMAHGEAIQADMSQAMPGETVTVKGMGFKAAGGPVAMTLEGTKGTFRLGSAEPGADGAFTFPATIPAIIAAASYRLVASQGDDSVSLDFSVMPMSAVQAGQMAQAAPAGAEGDHAADEELVVRRSATENLAIGIIVAALVVAGTVLVLAGTERRARPAAAPEGPVTEAAHS